MSLYKESKKALERSFVRGTFENEVRRNQENKDREYFNKTFNKNYSESGYSALMTLIGIGMVILLVVIFKIAAGG